MNANDILDRMATITATIERCNMSSDRLAELEYERTELQEQLWDLDAA